MDLARPYCAMVGGSETYGKFVETPFPALVSERTGVRTVNLGCVNAGLDVFVRDSAVQDICAGAGLTIIQALGAHNMSNRFYAVHPRRNDRFLRASAMLKAIYPEVDFTDFSFTRHLLTALQTISPDRFALVVEELQTAWASRMRMLAGLMGRRPVLLVLDLPATVDHDLGPEPLFISPEVIDRVRGAFADVVTLTPSREAMSLGTEGMVFAPMQESAAAHLPAPAIHREIAGLLEPVVRRLMI